MSSQIIKGSVVENTTKSYYTVVYSNDEGGVNWFATSILEISPDFAMNAFTRSWKESKRFRIIEIELPTTIVDKSGEVDLISKIDFIKDEIRVKNEETKNLENKLVEISKVVCSSCGWEGIVDDCSNVGGSPGCPKCGEKILLSEKEQISNSENSLVVFCLSCSWKGVVSDCLCDIKGSHVCPECGTKVWRIG